MSDKKTKTKLNPAFTKVVVLGAGGTGSILLPILARYLNSQSYEGEIIIVDGDSYEINNMDRQIFNPKLVKQNKAKVQCGVLSAQFANLDEQISFVDEFLGSDNLNKIVTENTIVINCTDNLAARKIVEDRVMTLKTGAHICCGNETSFGQVQICVRINGKQITPTIYHYHPELNSNKDDRSKMSCDELAKLPSGGQTIGANCMAAAIAFNYLTMLLDSSPLYKNGQFIPSDVTYFNSATNTSSALGQRVPS